MSDLTLAEADALDRTRHVGAPAPRGESYAGATRRVGRLLAAPATEPPGARVLLIGHTATRRALDSLLDGVALRERAAAPFEWRPGREYGLPTRARARIEA